MTQLSFSTHRLTINGAKDFPATAELLDTMSQLHADKVPEVFDDTREKKTTEFVAELVKSAENQIYVAEVASKIIGVLYASIQQTGVKPGWRVRRYGYLEAMFVKPNYRLNGIGAALVQAAEGHFKKEDIKLVELNVWDFNKEAQSLYQRLGFNPKNINMWRKL